LQAVEGSEETVLKAELLQAGVEKNSICAIYGLLTKVVGIIVGAKVDVRGIAVGVATGAGAGAGAGAGPDGELPIFLFGQCGLLLYKYIYILKYFL
jgi:hypothetical protein